MDEKYPDHRTGDKDQNIYAERAVAGGQAMNAEQVAAERAVAGGQAMNAEQVAAERAVAGGPATDTARADAERALADVPLTGDTRVDAAIAGLSRLAGMPPQEHVAVLEEAHGRLRDILGELAEDRR
ncbi:MAG: hypothetical protein ACRDOL_17445 [Streptosporangiaceae bacterium]